jgi:hypothetical protein
MKNLTAEQVAHSSSYKTANLLADLDDNFTEHEGDIALLAPKNNPIFTGSVTIPDPPTNANDAATKNYVDTFVGISSTFGDAVEDYVVALPNGIPITQRYILVGDQHIYTSDGDNTWTDLGHPATNLIVAFKANTAVPTEVGLHAFNGATWSYIPISGLHNSLTSMDGGGAGYYGHLTAAQHAIATQASTDALNGYLSAADHTIFNAKAPTVNAVFTGTHTVPDNTLAFSKLAIESANTILGRDGSVGNVIEIPCTAVGRSIIDDATTADVRTTIGLGNVTNESKATMFTNATFTGTTAGITKTMVGLGNADNTSDANKPVSTATQTALNLKANIASPTLTGVPAAPTAAVGTNTTQIATTAFVQAAIGAGGSYLLLSDGASYFRIQARSGALCIDQTMTALGFAGAENTDWANIEDKHL